MSSMVNLALIAKLTAALQAVGVHIDPNCNSDLSYICKDSELLINVSTATGFMICNNNQETISLIIHTNAGTLPVMLLRKQSEIPFIMNMISQQMLPTNKKCAEKDFLRTLTESASDVGFQPYPSVGEVIFYADINGRSKAAFVSVKSEPESSNFKVFVSNERGLPTAPFRHVVIVPTKEAFRAALTELKDYLETLEA